MSHSFAAFILHEAKRIPSPRHVLRNRLIERLRSTAKSGRSLKYVRRPSDLAVFMHNTGFEQHLIDASIMVWAEFTEWQAVSPRHKLQGVE